MFERFVKEWNRRERKFLKRTFKISNSFILSRTHSNSRTHFRSGMCSKSSRNKWEIFLDLITWTHRTRPSPSPHSKPTTQRKFQFNFCKSYTIRILGLLPLLPLSQNYTLLDPEIIQACSFKPKFRIFNLK